MRLLADESVDGPVVIDQDHWTEGYALPAGA